MDSNLEKGDAKDNGKPVGRRLSAEEKFVEAELLTTIMNVSSTAMMVLNPLGQILYANPASESVLGIKLNDILVRTYDAPEWKNSSLDGGPWREEDQPFNIVLKTKNQSPTFAMP